MINIAGESRYEVDGLGTVIHVSSAGLSDEVVRAIRERQQVTVSFPGENTGKHQKRIGRSIMIPRSFIRRPDGIDLILDIDYMALPVSKKEIDGRKY